MYGHHSYSSAPHSSLAGQATSTYVYAGSGGLVFAGAAALARSRAYTPAGGLVFGGAALLARSRAWSASGGLVFGGAAALARIRSWLGSGGLALGGAGAGVFEAGIPPEPREKALGLVAVWPGKVPAGERRRHDDDDEFLLLI